MTAIKLEFRGGQPLGCISVTESGELKIDIDNPLWRPRLINEIRELHQQGPLMERFGSEEILPDGTKRLVTKGRICTPGEPSYLQALAARIRRKGICISDQVVLAWAED